MSGAEFRDLAEGWTLHFRDEAGEYFGSEQYLPEGRTIWLPRGGRCEPGVWSEIRDQICFFYGQGDACWRLYRETDDEIQAVSADPAGPRTRLWLIRRDKSPILCPDGPGV